MPKTINLNITDARESHFKKLAPNLRKQTSVYLEGVTIDESNINDSFRVFVTQIKSLLSLNGSPYIPCNTDGCAITPDNLSLLRSDETILLFDREKQPLPFVISQIVNTTPHSHAVTNQSWAYPGNPEHNRAAFALGELVDNSLAATAKNEGARSIEIRFYDNGPSSFLHIIDNGCGMNSETLQEGLRYKAPKAARTFDARNFANEAELTQEFENDTWDSTYPRYINSNISKFGAGMKSCAFFFGGYLRVMTKRKENQAVHDVIYSKTELERRESSQGMEKLWHVVLKSRNPGIMDESEASGTGSPIPWRIKEFIEEEKGKSSFTHTVVAELIGGAPGEKNSSSPLEVLRRGENLGTSIERQLAHMYHYYIHGREGATFPRAAATGKKNSNYEGQGLVDIIVRRFAFKDGDPVIVSSINLRDIQPDSALEDLESKFIRTSEDCFRFTIEVGEFNQTSSDSTFKVGGIIRYHPYHFDGETHPEGLLTRKDTGNGLTSDDLDNEAEDMDVDVPEIGDESDEGNGQSPPHGSMQRAIAVKASSSSASQHVATHAFKKCKDFFYVWWNGRLIPLVRLESFDWCSPSSKLSPNDPIYKCYDRISGSLFLDSNVNGIAENKLMLSEKDNLMKIFHQTSTIGTQQATFGRIYLGNDGEPKSMRMKGSAKKEFDDWIKNAHKKDKQVKYSGYLGTVSKKYLNSTKEYNKFRQAQWDLKLKIGDPIRCVTTKPHIIGTVKCFLVDKSNDDNANIALALSPNKVVGAPLSLVEIEQAPQALFVEEDILVIKPMARVDTTATLESIQMAIAEKEKELEMELEFCDWYGHELEGAEIPMDGKIINKLHMRIKRKDNGNEVPGALSHANKHKAKKIQLAIRCYRYYDDETRELHFTSKLCPYFNSSRGKSNQGYYFKTIDTKEAYIVEPGNYVLTFWSYVDISGKAKAISQSTNPKSKEAAMSLPNPRLRRTNSRSGFGGENGGNSTVVGVVGVVVGAAAAGDDDVPFDECFDELGRHTLRCGSRLIPLPTYDGIKFKVVAGPPHKFKIENIGEGEDDRIEFKIGEPFDITLSFEDTKGNPTKPKPEEIQALIPDPEQPLVFVAPAARNSKKEKVELKFLYKDLILKGDFVVIRGVVVKGFLGTQAQYDCRIGVRLRWKNNRLETCPPSMVRFSAGPPNYITIAEESIEIENGNFAWMTCHVKDVCGNLITHTELNKPILLSCEIFKGKSEKAFEDKKLIKQLEILAADRNIEPKKLPMPIYIEKLTNGEKDKTRLICKVSLENCPNSATIRLNVHPSSKPETLKMYYPKFNEDGIPEKVELTSLKLKVGEAMDNLTFKIFNGRNEEVNRDPSKYSLRFDWPSKISPSKSAMKTIFETGVLPRLVTPSGAIALKECITTLVSLAPPSENNLAVELQHKFNLQTVALDPADLKVNVVGHLSGVRVAVPVDEIDKMEILVKVVDTHGNLIREVEHNEIEVDMAELPYIKFDHIVCAADDNGNAPNGSFLIRNIEFPISLPPFGEKNLIITFRENIQAKLQLNFIPGKPASLAFEIEGDIVAKQEGGSTKKIVNQSTPRIKVHLKDLYGNGVSGTGKTVLLTFAKKMMGFDKALKQVTDSQGIADFRLVPIGVKPGEVPSVCSPKFQNDIQCTKKCYNVHHITAKCEDITANCCFHITCRPNVPAKLNIQLGRATCTADSNFDDEFYVTLEAEDDSLILEAKVEDLTLTMTSESGRPGPARVFELNPISFQEGIYTFGAAPQEAGYYRLEFTYNDGARRFGEKVEKKFRICSSVVKSIEPLRHNVSGTIFVSNDPDDVARRTIISGNFSLVLKDEYKNVVKEHLNQSEMSSLEERLNGKVKLEISGDGADRIRFENHEQLFTNKIPLNNGVADIPSIILVPENTNIPNKSEFRLTFTATLHDRTVYTYELHFVFYNDVSQQKVRQELENQLRQLDKELKTTKVKYRYFCQELKKLEDEWEKIRKIELTHSSQNSPGISGVVNVRSIEAREKFLTAQQINLERSRRGTASNIEEWEIARTEKDALGTIGLLAQVKSEGGGIDEDIRLQTILSWQMQDKLSSVAMLDSQKGIHYSKKYPQIQFMLLDTIPNQFSKWDEEIHPELRGFGNPRFAKSLLELTPKDQSLMGSVQKVFNSILGRTVIVDTLEDATNYKKAFNRSNRGGSCGTILTRDGDRLCSNGMIGGSKNRAPVSPTQLKYKFGLAPSQDLLKMDSELKGLKKLKDIVKRRIEAEMTLGNYKDVNQNQIEQTRIGLAALEGRRNAVKDKLDHLDEEQQNQTLMFNSQIQQGDEEVSSTSGTGVRLMPSPAQGIRRRHQSQEDGPEAATSKRSRN